MLCRRFLWNTCLSSVLFIIWFYCMLCNSYWTGKESKWVSLVDYRVRQSSARSNGNSGKKSSTCVRRFGSQFAINTLMLKTSSWQSHYYCSQKDLKESLFDCSFIFFYMMLLMRNIFLDKNDWLKFSKQWNSTLQLWSHSKLRSLQGFVRIKMSLNFILFILSKFPMAEYNFKNKLQ